MKTLALLCMLASTGCFTTWAGGQATGHSFAWDENVRQETVPLPAREEHLDVKLPLNGDTQLACSSTQIAAETVHRSSVRYGRGWKKAMAIGFVTEAAIAGLFVLAGDRNDVRTHMYGGLFALDAVGTGALAFVPRKERFTHNDRNVATIVREDCPEGLVLEIAGTSYPVDAAGHIGEAGEVAFEDWMKTRTGALLLSLGGQATEIRIPTTVPGTLQAPTAYTTLVVPVGTLTALAE